MRDTAKRRLSGAHLAATLSVGLLIAAGALLAWAYWPSEDCGWGQSPVSAAGIALCW